MVWKSYYFDMDGKPQASERQVAELIAYLGRIIYGESFAGGLTPAQWTVLRYLSRANRFSRTVSAFAEFHTTTRGTASQTVKSLVTQGYLTRTRLEADGRSARLDLTDEAWSRLASDPFEVLVRAAGSLSANARSRLTCSLERMLGHVANERGKPLFGVCPSCEHLKGDQCHRKGKASYQCAFTSEPLEPAELKQICINFKPKKRLSRNATSAAQHCDKPATTLGDHGCKRKRG